ncbi:MAG TPA: DUF4129 domain-containing protein [Gemmataceae bacterium]|nr:DUF4129 domain-containing protein [Gemmataceae bacterium]
MPAARPRPTVADYLVIAVSPALIMALVGSLAFFLLEVFYSGQYEGRMQWILFFYILGIVLAARISMLDSIAARSWLYGAVLTVLTFLGMQGFVEYPPGLAEISWAVNAALLGVTWWCAYRLMWDCTFIDEKADPGGAGLLEAAGLKQSGQPAAEEPAAAGQKKPGWFERYQRYREERKKKQSPGVWVVYFSLAALPIFGLGQALIPAEEEGRRRYVFWLMCLYVGSALGLLLTTCFLGLRRYLRQRKVEMPKTIAGVWLTLGAGLIVALLVIGAFLPRPQAEYGFLNLSRLTSKEREASRFAVKGDSPGKDDGRGGPQQEDAKARQTVEGKKDQPGKDSQGKGSQKDAKSSSKGDPGKDAQSGKKGQNNDQAKKDGASKDRQDGPQAKKQDGEGKQAEKSSEQTKDRAGEQKQSGKGSSSGNKALNLLSKLSGIGPILKWIVFGLLAAAVVFFLLRSGLRWLANFTDWAKNLLAALRAFWERLFGGGRRREAVGAEADEVNEPGQPPRRPFSSYVNPFLDGRAEGMSPDEVVRYTFAALEAWAWEQGTGQHAHETPLEFAERLGREVPGLEAEARRLASLYARAAYARGSLSANCLPSVRQFWERLAAVAEQPLSA